MTWGARQPSIFAQLETEELRAASKAKSAAARLMRKTTLQRSYAWRFAHRWLATARGAARRYAATLPMLQQAVSAVRLVRHVLLARREDRRLQQRLVSSGRHMPAVPSEAQRLQWLQAQQMRRRVQLGTLDTFTGDFERALVFSSAFADGIDAQVADPLQHEWRIAALPNMASSAVPGRQNAKVDPWRLLQVAVIARCERQFLQCIAVHCYAWGAKRNILLDIATLYVVSQLLSA